MKTILPIFFTLVIIIAINGCYYDKGELLYPQKASNCDTSSVISYSAKVVPILTTQCYSCHIGTSAGGGIVMGTHATDKVTAVNGKLYGSINHSSGYSAMPKGAAKMDACQIQLIKKWIDAGSLNN
jgi:hypothetical protein